MYSQVRDSHAYKLIHFQKNVADGKLFTPDYSIEKMTSVIDNLTSENSGGCFAWDGERIEF